MLSRQYFVGLISCFSFGICLHLHQTKQYCMMKKILLLIATMCGLGFAMAAQTPGTGGLVIPPVGDNGPGGKPKAPAYYPLTVIITDDASAFILNNYTYMGTETITIVSPSGCTYSQTIDSNIYSTFVIPVISEYGYWTVTVTTDTSGTFYGFYQLE